MTPLCGCRRIDTDGERDPLPCVPAQTPASHGRPRNTGRRQQYCGSDPRLWERGWQFIGKRRLLFRFCVDPSRRNVESRPRFNQLQCRHWNEQPGSNRGQLRTDQCGLSRRNLDSSQSDPRLGGARRHVLNRDGHQRFSSSRGLFDTPVMIQVLRGRFDPRLHCRSVRALNTACCLAIRACTPWRAKAIILSS